MSSREKDPGKLQPYDEAIIEDIRRALANGAPLEVLKEALADSDANSKSADIRRALLVKLAREHKITWAAIGLELGGVTKQAAHEYWTKNISQLDDSV